MTTTAQKSIPEILFKYLDAGGLKLLENLELMFSNPADFNDPFEFLPSLLSELKDDSCGSDRTSKTQQVVKKYGCNSFIFSMTDKEHNVRMWDHYGDKHQGLMISLDFGDVLAQYYDWILPVKYSSQSRFEPLNCSLTTNEKTQSFRNIVTHKGKDWEPESEFRWILPAVNCNLPGTEKTIGQIGELRLVEGKMKAFLTIEPSSILKVTLGYLSSQALLDSVQQLRGRMNARWKVARVKLSLNTFQFEDEWIEN